MAKIGRNERCPCGSGKKFKKCCLGRRVGDVAGPAAEVSVADKVDRKLAKAAHYERLRRQRFGRVRPVITTKHDGRRFIVVGSRIYFHQNWNTFADFLLFYVKDVFGKEWWTAELSKPEPERHPIVRWEHHITAAIRARQPEEDGLVSTGADGLTNAYILLAYDLYVLRDHSRLEQVVVDRLRKRDQFGGARYELFVAATCLRAGFHLVYEDEGDSSRKHPEFCARHAGLGLTLSVEAKARQRQLPTDYEPESIRPYVRDLLLNAAKKKDRIPLVAFVDLLLPPQTEPTGPPTWLSHVDAALDEVIEKCAGTNPFALVVFTNRPHVYGLAGEPDPSRDYFARWGTEDELPLEVIKDITVACQQYGNIPDSFPDEFSDFG